MVLNSSNISPVGIERILLFSSAKDTDFYFQIPNQTCIPRTKTLSQALLVNIVSFIKLYIFIIVVFVLFWFLLQFTLCLLCSCFLRSSAEKVCYCLQKLHILYTNIWKCIFFYAFVSIQVNIFSNGPCAFIFDCNWVSYCQIIYFSMAMENNAAIIVKKCFLYVTK